MTIKKRITPPAPKRPAKGAKIYNPDKPYPGKKK